MKTKLFALLVSLMLVASLFVLPANAETTGIVVPKGTVTVDGTMNNDEWAGAYELSLYDKYKDALDVQAAAVCEMSVFRMMWDENFLYVGYNGVYVESLFAATDHGGFCSGEVCTFTVMDSLTAEAYTNHISFTPNLTVNPAGAASVLNQANLMSYHKQDGSAAYYPENAKIVLDAENGIYTIEVKIPWTEINLDRSKTTAAEGDSFVMKIEPNMAGQLLSVTDGNKTVTLGAAPVVDNGGNDNAGDNNDDTTVDDNTNTGDMTVALVATIGVLAAAVVLTKKR